MAISNQKKININSLLIQKILSKRTLQPIYYNKKKTRISTLNFPKTNMRHSKLSYAQHNNDMNRFELPYFILEYDIKEVRYVHPVTPAPA